MNFYSAEQTRVTLNHFSPSEILTGENSKSYSAETQASLSSRLSFAIRGALTYLTLPSVEIKISKVKLTGSAEKKVAVLLFSIVRSRFVNEKVPVWLVARRLP